MAWSCSQRCKVFFWERGISWTHPAEVDNSQSWGHNVVPDFCLLLEWYEILMRISSTVIDSLSGPSKTTRMPEVLEALRLFFTAMFRKNIYGSLILCLYRKTNFVFVFKIWWQQTNGFSVFYKIVLLVGCHFKKCRYIFQRLGTVLCTGLCQQVRHALLASHQLSWTFLKRHYIAIEWT